MGVRDFVLAERLAPQIKHACHSQHFSPPALPERSQSACLKHVPVKKHFNA
jgi:hypothetical protein